MRSMVLVAAAMAAFLAAAASLPVAAAEVSEDGITVSDARVDRPAAEGEAAVVSMKIRNDKGRTSKLVVVESPAAARTTLHEAVGNGDSAGMQPVPSISISGGGRERTLAADRQHVMLIGLKRSLQPGDTVKISLQFFPGPTLDVVAPVQGGNMEAPSGGNASVTAVPTN